MLEGAEARNDGGLDARRPYEPPKLARVGLEADEVLGYNCKGVNEMPSALQGKTCFFAGCNVPGS